MHHFARSLLPGSARHLLPRTTKRVVVVGGGPTGLFCADRLRHHFEVTVVDAKSFFEFTPSVLRTVVDPSHLSKITFDYREVLEKELGVEFVLGEASRVEASPPGQALRRGAVQVTGAEGPMKLHFDYLVVAVGVSNGLWKPRLGQEPAEFTVAGAGGAGQSRKHPLPQVPAELSIETRRHNLRQVHERIAGSQGAMVVGAGLVGVELAAELVHFFPRLKVTLVDGATDVLPQLGEGARSYARNWLQQHNVAVRLGRPFRPESVADGQVVLTCVGTRTRSASLFSDSSVLRRKGQIRVNRHMQVLHRPGAALSSLGSLGSLSSVSDPMPGEPSEEAKTSGLEPLGQGTIFAVGDAASVEGVPTAQVIFHGEEMAAVAVANIEAAEDIVSPLALTKGRREMDAQQPFLCCTSLGPHDGMFSTQTELVATGTLAAIQKQMIEVTKMGALKGELVSSALWYPVH